jgi:hypothetical protein
MRMRPRGGYLRRVPDVALVAVGGTALAAAALLALLHLDDRYMVGHVSGAWMGLAAAVGDGTLYPPPHEDGFFGGTRFMPLFFVAHGGLALLTDELLVSGKVLTYASAAGLVALLLVLLRRRGTPWPLSIGLAGALVASWAATSTVFGIRGDSLAVLLQLGAVAVLAERVTSGRAASAGLLSGLALFVKLSALWAPAAVVVWLALTSRRALLPFLGAFAATAGLLFALVESLSSGRFSENLREFAFAGSGGESALQGARRLYELALRDQRSLWPILLLAAAAALIALAQRPGVYELAFVAAGGILLVVLRDLGAYENHLLDVSVLAALVVGGAWSSLTGRLRDVFRALAVVAVLLATALAARHTLAPDLRTALRHGDDDARFSTRPLEGLVSFDACVLSEDPALPLLAGYRPVVLDAFIVRRLDREDAESLRQRVDRREFPHIVLLAPATDPVQYTSFDFTPEIAAAVRSRYRLAAQVPEASLWVYERTPGSQLTCLQEPR